MAEIKLKKISVRGFRSIKECDIDFGDVNVLIGPNGSGKSNLISAFYLLQNITGKTLQYYVAKNGASSLLFKGPKVTNKIEMEFVFDANSYGFVLEINGEGKLVFADEYYGWSGGHWSLDRTPYGYESEFENGLPNLITKYVKPVLQAKKWRVYHFHDTTYTQGMKQVASLQDTVSLAHDASNIAAFLLMLQRSYPESYRDILSAVRLVAPFFDDFVLEPNQENKELVGLRWRQKGYETVFGANQLSDGTLRFICLATVLLQPSELQPSAIILDEPELGLHPYAVQIFAELVHSVSRRKQVIISTQSAALLSCFDADDVIVAETSDEGSVYRRLSSEELEGWLEDYTLGEIWEKNIIGGRP